MVQWLGVASEQEGPEFQSAGWLGPFSVQFYSATLASSHSLISSYKLALGESLSVSLC